MISIDDSAVAETAHNSAEGRWHVKSNSWLISLEPLWGDFWRARRQEAKMS